MKKVPNYLKIPLGSFVLAIIYTLIFHHLDLTLLLGISALTAILGGCVVYKKIPKYFKVALVTVILVFLYNLVTYNFYLSVASVIALLIASIVLIIIDEYFYIPIKIVTASVLVLVLCWLGVMLTDMYKLHRLEEPVFARLTENMSSEIEYQGICYSIYLKYDYVHTNDENAEKQIVQGTMYILNQLIAGVTT